VGHFEFVLKGTGFSRAVTATKSIAALQFAGKRDNREEGDHQG
jgi:hypothetical protein